MCASALRAARAFCLALAFRSNSFGGPLVVDRSAVNDRDGHGDRGRGRDRRRDRSCERKMDEAKHECDFTREQDTMISWTCRRQDVRDAPGVGF